MFDLSEDTIPDDYFSTGVPTPIDDDPEDLEVQIRLTPQGEWHRRAFGGGGHLTACGKPGGYMIRDESYAGDLCRDGCYSQYELAQNEIENKTKPPATTSRLHMQGTRKP